MFSGKYANEGLPFYSLLTQLASVLAYIYLRMHYLDTQYRIFMLVQSYGIVSSADTDIYFYYNMAIECTFP